MRVALVFGVRVADSYACRDLSRLWAGVLSLVACLPVFYGVLRCFRISGRVAEVFSLPEPNLPSPTMALGVFRVFCAVLPVGTASMPPLVGLETIGVFDGPDREPGMVLLFYLPAGMPQLVFPLNVLIMTARWQAAIIQNRQPARGLRSARINLY